MPHDNNDDKSNLVQLTDGDAIIWTKVDPDYVTTRRQ